MASFIVHGLNESVKAGLMAQTKGQHGRSAEVETREALTEATSKPNIGIALLEVAQRSGGDLDLAIPKRTEAAGAVTFE